MSTLPAAPTKAMGDPPATAWKRSPGDKQATGKPKAVSLQPGDIAKFKGGVQYPGEIQFSNLKGAEGQPIVIDGNADGKYGKGPAILDGAKMITGWKNVLSAGQVDGNANHISIADCEVRISGPVRWSPCRGRNPCAEPRFRADRLSEASGCCCPFRDWRRQAH